MSLYVNTALVGTIAFIMVFTYASELVFYLDSSSFDKEYLNIKTSLSSGNVTTTTDNSFSNWVNINYQISIKTGNDLTNYINEYKVFKWDILQTVMMAFKAIDNNKYENYETGVNFVNHFFSDYGISSYPYNKNFFINEYEKWKSAGGLDRQVEDVSSFYIPIISEATEFIDATRDFLGRVPGYFNTFIDLATFNIKTTHNKIDVKTGKVMSGETEAIPGVVRTVLLIFFIPMWIVLAIEILPLIAKLIEAIGSLIPL